MIFLSVNTPTKEKGIGAGKASDLKWVEASAREIGSYAKGNSIVVVTSFILLKIGKAQEGARTSIQQEFLFSFRSLSKV